MHHQSFVRRTLLALSIATIAAAAAATRADVPKTAPKLTSLAPLIKSPGTSVVLAWNDTKMPIKWDMGDVSNVSQFEVCYWKEGGSCDHDGTQRFFRASTAREATIDFGWHQKAETWLWTVAACDKSGAKYAERCRHAAPPRKVLVDAELPKPTLSSPQASASFPPQVVGQTVPKINFKWSAVTGATHYLLCIRRKQSDTASCLNHSVTYGDGGDIVKSTTNSVEWSTYLYTPPANCTAPCQPVPPEESRTYYWRAGACREVGVDKTPQCSYSQEARAVVVKRAP